MDCETCNDLLLDLHYDELDAARAGEVRAHLAQCEACRRASERLARARGLVSTLALPDPPTHSAAVMAALAAIAPVASAASGRVSAVIPIKRAREARSTGWMQRVGELAMRRQVAMVAISLLMVGLGLRYLPFRSPTQSVTTEISQPEVIPATELSPTTVAQSVPPIAQGTAAPMRARGPAAHVIAPAEGRAGGRPSSAEPLRGASTGREAEPDLLQAQRTLDEGAPGAAARSGAVETTNTPLPAAAATRASNGYGGLAGVPQDEERQLELAMPPPPAPVATSWSVARNNAESAATRGDRAATIASYQRALALDPPATERQAIALSLHRSLLSAGRIDEANRVRAQYLTQAADATALAGQVSPSVPRTQTAAGVAQPSAPRPAATRPARRSNSNINNDFNQSAY